MTDLIECPWCKNKYETATGFNNHFYDEDLTDIHRENKNYSTKKAKSLIDQYYTALEKQEHRIKTLKFIRQNEHLKQKEINEMLKSL